MPRSTRHHKKPNVSGPSPPQSSPWSEWITRPEGRGWYCSRTDSNGQIEYQLQDDNDPRSCPSIDEISDGLSNTSLQSATDAVSPYGLGSRTSSNDAGKNNYGDGRAGLSTSYGSGGYSNAQSTTSPSKPDSSSYCPQPNTNVPQYASYLGGSTSHAPYYYSQSTNLYILNGEQFASTSISNDYLGGKQREGMDGNGDAGYQMGNQSGSQTGSQMGYQMGNQNPTAIKSGQGTPRAKSPNSKFHIRKAKFFKVGRVLKVVWWEPMGFSNSDQDVVLSAHKIYTTIRRFVVIREDRKHSQCLPILTYSHQGLRKPSVDEQDHVVVYTGVTNSGFPPLAPGEVLSREPIRILPATPLDKLNNMSRLNLSKIYTIEHNVPVVDIGFVAPDHLVKLKNYFLEVWNR